MIEPAKPASPARRLLLVVAIPLIILALGGWQVVRGSNSASDFVHDRRELATEQVRLETFVARFPGRSVQFGDDPTVYSGSDAVQKLHDASANAGWYELAARVRLGFAVAATAGAGMGLLAGLIGLATAAWAQRHSRRSRDAVQAAFSRVRVMLPWLLAAQVAGLTLALGSAVLFEMIGLVIYGELGSQTLRAVEGGLAITLIMVWLGWLALRELHRSLRAFTPAPMPIVGRQVPRAEAPGLWRMIDELAAGQHATTPEHVVVGLMAGFFVTSSDLEVHPGGTTLHGRTLHLPLPLLAMLDADETEAVIAHELAHFAGEDTVYTTRFLPIYAGIERNLDALSVIELDSTVRLMQAPAMLLGKHMMAVFDRAVKHWSRVRELEADAATRLPCGPRAPARALVRLALLSSVADGVMAETAATPQSAPPDLVEAIVQRAAQDGFPDPQAALSDSQPHPTDTHPPTIARIEALGLTADEYLLSRAGRPVQSDELDKARGLFTDWDALCRGLTTDAVSLATVQRDRREAALRTIAAQRTEAETPVFQDTRTAMWMAPLGLVFGLLGVVGVYFLIATLETDPTTLLSVVGCALLGGVSFWHAFGVLRSRNVPYLTLKADGFVCPGLDRMVPWVCVENVGLVEGQIVSLTFQLGATAALPRTLSQPGPFKTVQVNARRRWIVLNGKPRGMKPDALLKLIARYLSAAHAHAALNGPPALVDATLPATRERREPRLGSAVGRPSNPPRTGTASSVSSAG